MYTVSRSGASGIQPASSSPFAEAMETGLPEKLKSKGHPVRAELSKKSLKTVTGFLKCRLDAAI